MLQLVENPVGLTLLATGAWVIGIAVVGLMDHQSRGQNDSLANCHPGLVSDIGGHKNRRRGWW